MMKTKVIQFYNKLYSNDISSVGKFLLRRKFPMVYDEKFCKMDREITMEEVYDALFGMTPLKALGVDGCHVQFYQSKWEVIGDSLVEMVRRAFKDGSFDRYFNKTLLVLIPKVPTPELITQFRPISLCIVPYKVLSKVIVNRLKPFM